MKVFTSILKILAVLAAVAGVVYVVATYGDKIVAWAKKLLGMSCCGCADCECNEDGECLCDCECDTCDCCDCDDEVCEAPAGEPAAAEADFEG